MAYLSPSGIPNISYPRHASNLDLTRLLNSDKSLDIVETMTG